MTFSLKFTIAALSLAVFTGCTFLPGYGEVGEASSSREPAQHEVAGVSKGASERSRAPESDESTATPEPEAEATSAGPALEPPTYDHTVPPGPMDPDSFLFMGYSIVDEEDAAEWLPAGHFDPSARGAHDVALNYLEAISDVYVTSAQDVGDLTFVKLMAHDDCTECAVIADSAYYWASQGIRATGHDYIPGSEWYSEQVSDTHVNVIIPVTVTGLHFWLGDGTLAEGLPSGYTNAVMDLEYIDGRWRVMTFDTKA